MVRLHVMCAIMFHHHSQVHEGPLRQRLSVDIASFFIDTVHAYSRDVTEVSIGRRQAKDFIIISVSDSRSKLRSPNQHV